MALSSAPPIWADLSGDKGLRPRLHRSPGPQCQGGCFLPGPEERAPCPALWLPSGPAPGGPAHPHCWGSRWRVQGSHLDQEELGPLLAVDSSRRHLSVSLVFSGKDKNAQGPRWAARTDFRRAHRVGRVLRSARGSTQLRGRGTVRTLNKVPLSFSLSPHACAIGSDTTGNTQIRVHTCMHRGPRTAVCRQSRGFTHMGTHTRSHTHPPFFPCT